MVTVGTKRLLGGQIDLTMSIWNSYLFNQEKNGQ